MSKFITVETSTLVFIYCLTSYSQSSDIGTCIKSTSTSLVSTKIAIILASISKRFLFPLLFPDWFLSLKFLSLLLLLFGPELLLSLLPESFCLNPLPLKLFPFLLGGVTSGFQGFVFGLFLRASFSQL